ncbi:hypothetical protein BC830DRAFT_373707 [Chytriomyces sp. MP71]|nr:hypothetical protein BC830DRAFT_373707 [Chytriomyces sp. MP71]
MSTLLHLLAAAALGSPPLATDFPVNTEPILTGVASPIFSKSNVSDESGIRRAARACQPRGSPAPGGIDKPYSPVEPSTPAPSEDVASTATSLESTPNLAHFEAASETGFPVMAASPYLAASSAPRPHTLSPFRVSLPSSAPKRYECKQCGKIFLRKHHLVSHLVSHSEGKPFTCQIPGCDSMFRRMQDMRRHMRKVRHDFPLPHHTPGVPPSREILAEAEVSMSLLAPPADNQPISNVEISSDFQVESTQRLQLVTGNPIFSHTA